jgi:hypothetical protein
VARLVPDDAGWRARGRSEDSHRKLGHALVMKSIDRSRPGVIWATVAEATGEHRRDNPVLPRTGGPAGNAALTAWTGLVLLVLSIAELLTLLDVHGLLTWHVAIGALLVPPALVKTASTSWRIFRYYTGNEPYQQAGPPPTLLRLLGPLVVISTLGLLGTGVVLILIGQPHSHTSLLTLLSYRIDWLTLHQGAFIVWAAATGLHLLGRIVPAVRTVLGKDSLGPIPGAAIRATLIVTAAVLAVGLALVLVHADASWATRQFFHHGLDTA